MILRTKAILIGLLVVLLVGVPPGLGQQPPVDSQGNLCLLYTSPSPRDLSTSRMPSSA